MTKKWIHYIMVFTLLTIIGNEVSMAIYGILNQNIVCVEDLHEDNQGHTKKIDKKKSFDEKYFSNHLQSKSIKLTSGIAEYSENANSYYPKPVIEKHIPPPNLS